MSNNIQEINQKIIKKGSEISFAEFFIGRFNQKYNLNYQVVPNYNDSSDIDIYAIVETCETLNLQLKTGDSGWDRFFSFIKKHGSSLGSWGGNNEKLLVQIIKNNENHYPNKENLILLITERYEPVWDKNYALRISVMFINSNFKGIYIVNSPSFEGNSSSDGQIVAVKDIFGNHGEIF